MWDPKNFWPIWQVEISEKAVKDTTNYSRFCDKNPKLITKLWEENRKLMNLLHSQPNPEEYLSQNPGITKVLGLSQEELLAVLQYVPVTNIPTH